MYPSMLHRHKSAQGSIDSQLFNSRQGKACGPLEMPGGWPGYSLWFGSRRSVIGLGLGCVLIWSFGCPLFAPFLLFCPVLVLRLCFCFAGPLRLACFLCSGLVSLSVVCCRFL
jgi:hypothetical protein